MKLRLYKMGLEGAIALGNLLLVVIVMLVFLNAFPGGNINWDTPSEKELLIARWVDTLITTLTFPIGWLCHLFAPLWTAIIFVPLNAYLWGYTGARILRLIKRLLSAVKASRDS